MLMTYSKIVVAASVLAAALVAPPAHAQGRGRAVGRAVPRAGGARVVRPPVVTVGRYRPYFYGPRVGVGLAFGYPYYYGAYPSFYGYPYAYGYPAYGYGYG